MHVYRIADLNINIKCKYPQTNQQLLPYVTHSEDIDLEIDVTKDEINQFISESDTPCTDHGAESVIILKKLCNAVLERFDGFFFHSSSLMLDGEAYVFTAPSGTGKSTHTSLWRQLFGERITMINDDKPIIRKSDGRFFIYGTPWMGKSNIGNNIKAPVKAVYILKRGTKNSAIRVKIGEVFPQILEATVIPTDKSNMIRLLELLDRFFSQTPIYLLTCNTDIEAAEVAYNVSNSTKDV